MKHRAIYVSAAAAIFVAGLGYWIWSSMFPPTLADDANDFLLAGFQGDGDALLHHADPHEIRLLGLTREKARSIAEQVLRPNFAGLGSLRIVQKGLNEMDGVPTQGYCRAEVKDKSGNPFTLFAVVNATDEGGKGFITARIEEAWRINYAAKNHVTHPTLLSNTLAKLEGYSHDKGQLARLGVGGEADSQGNFMSWDQCVNHWKSIVAMESAKSPDGQS